MKEPESVICLYIMIASVCIVIHYAICMYVFHVCVFFAYAFIIAHCIYVIFNDLLAYLLTYLLTYYCRVQA